MHKQLKALLEKFYFFKAIENFFNIKTEKRRKVDKNQSNDLRKQRLARYITVKILERWKVPKVWKFIINILRI